MPETQTVDNESINNLILKRLTAIETQLESVKTIQTSIITIQENLTAVIQSQQHINLEFEKQRQQIDILSKKNALLEQHVNSLHTRNDEKTKQINQLEEGMNDLEQYGRRSMVDVRGIPRCHNEDTDQLILDVAKLIKVDMNKSDIEISHRVSSNENASIIVKFQSRRKRNEFYSARSTLYQKSTRDIGFENN